MKDNRVHPPEIGDVKRLQVDGEIFEVRQPTMDIIMSALWASGQLTRSLMTPSTEYYKSIQAAKVDINIKTMVKTICLLEKEIVQIREAQAAFLKKINSKLDEMNFKPDEGATDEIRQD